MKKFFLMTFICLGLAFGAESSIDEGDLANKVATTKTATKTSQIILVTGDKLSAWQKNSNGKWQMVLISKSGHGKNGFSRNRHEGENTTPVGSFPILYAFGLVDNPGAAMEYRKITPDSYLSGENDDTYNTWVESKKPLSKDSEHLIDYYQYEYAMNIGFNIDPVKKGLGSAIFLHVKSHDHWTTAGCVSVPKDIMKHLVLWAKNGTYIIIVEDESKIGEF